MRSTLLHGIPNAPEDRPDRKIRLLGVITATPTDPRVGSGCAVATSNLIQEARRLGVNVRVRRPVAWLPCWTAHRLLFNELLRFWRPRDVDATVGIDLDGYAMPRSKTPHIANIKGVLADAVQFESGITRFDLALQARLEARHVSRADKVITISRYCAEKIRSRYGFRGTISVVPESIDLGMWRLRLANAGGRPPSDRFVVLCVCRHYRRKRVDVLLRAASLAVRQVPGLLVRVVGDGPRHFAWQRLSRELGLEQHVDWLGPLHLGELAREYASAHVFCLPSAQEGFGIVFLEAMAAGLPIVASDAAAVPEVVPHALLCQPGAAEQFAGAIIRLHDDAGLRQNLSKAGLARVTRYDILPVTLEFLSEIERC